MTIYFLSGLGADKRVFEKLDLPDSVELVFIEWIRPFNEESLRGYAERISAEIDRSKPFILVGFSFGGILVTEMLEFVNPQKTILISSIASISEMGFVMKIAGLLKFNRLLPLSSANKVNNFIYWLFGVKDNSEKDLFKEIFESSNLDFSKWAIEAMTNWRRMQTPAGLIRIHGTRDRIFPIVNFKPGYTVKDGGHFMVHDRAHETSRIFREILGAV